MAKQSHPRAPAFPPLPPRLAASALRGEARRVARRLLGALLVEVTDGAPVVARIVETEAYCQADPASHSFRGRTPRNEAMFGRAGLAYVYRSYGLHWCLNVSCGADGEGAAVLLRALEPVRGIETMQRRRAPTGAMPATQLCRGPGNLAQAMGVTLATNGRDLLDTCSPIYLADGPPIAAPGVRQAPRVGISRAAHKLWRFYAYANPHVSGPRNGLPLARSAPVLVG